MADDLDPAAVERAVQAWAEVYGIDPSLIAESDSRAIRAALAAAGPLVTPEHDALPGCTGDYECPAPAHQHGCMTDTEGHCNEPQEHSDAAARVPSVEEVAAAVALAQNVPFVGPKQRRIAERVVALWGGGERG